MSKKMKENFNNRKNSWLDQTQIFYQQKKTKVGICLKEKHMNSKTQPQQHKICLIY